ncbi:MAG: desulfoferrodoxin family protein [Velocimicrobium sp.]
MKQRFFKCELCGNVIAFVEDKGTPLSCCGQHMTELIPGAVEAAVEKHVPVVSVEGNKVTVTVSTVEHPMTEGHYIQWISLETKQGNQRKMLTPQDKPVAEFMLCDEDEVVAAYAYCNLHGLWKSAE